MVRTSLPFQEKLDVLAIIPAKGNSRRLPEKNIQLFLGKPLVVWSVEAALESDLISRVAVSSDSNKILECAETLGAEALCRPSCLATDSSSSESVVQHVLESLRANGDCQPQTIVLLQPTSPQRTAGDIDDAITLFRTEKATSLVSGYEPTKSPLKDFVSSPNGDLTSLRDLINVGVDPLFLNNMFRPNGAIFITKTKEFEQTGKLVNGRCIPFFMDIKRSVDIDSLEEFKTAERIMAGK